MKYRIWENSFIVGKEHDASLLLYKLSEIRFSLKVYIYYVLFPSLQLWEELFHRFTCFFYRVFHFRVFIELIEVIQVEFDHFVHRAFLRERSVPETKMTVRFVWGSVGVRAELGGVRKRHSATLTEFLFHN